MPVRIVAGCGLLVVALSFALSGAARADGCYVPERAVQKLPEIPAQRALVAFRDGRETLIVESQLQGEGRRFGWIIPVPAKPDSIEAASPGTLKSLAMGIQPKIRHDLHGLFEATTALSALVLLLVLVVCGSKRPGRAVSNVLAVGLLLVFACSLLLPATLGAAHSTFSQPIGAEVLDRSRVGAYEIAVVAAEDADGLYAWLEGEELAVPAALRPAVDDYARRGWRFVTAKLATDGSGQAAPHPLRIAFRTDRAVYPMKLTGLSGRALDLELYVVGEKAAEVQGMKRIFCDKFVEEPAGAAHSGDYRDPVNAAMPYDRGMRAACFKAVSCRLVLGHLGLMPVLWNGCWVSKLIATIAPERMGEDYYVAWSEPAFERQTLYSRQGAQAVAWSIAVLLFTAAVSVAMVLWGWRRTSGARLGGAILGSLLAAAVVFGAVVLLLPKTEVSVFDGKGTRGRENFFHWQALLHQPEAIEEQPSPTAESVRSTLARWNLGNLYTGEPALEEDSPGNYTVAEKDGQLLLTLYDLGGTPVTVELQPQMNTDEH